MADSPARMHAAVAQATARDALARVGIDVADTVMVTLTSDATTGPHPVRFEYRVTPEQIRAGAQELCSATGEPVDVGALLDALPQALPR